MPRRTLREARSVFEGDLAPSLNPTMHARLVSELTEAESRAAERAEAFLASEVEDIEAARHELLVEVCQVRDQYEALAARVGSGEVTAREAGRDLAKLNRRMQAAQEALAKTDDRISELASVEDDPLGWVDRRYEAAPLTRPLFSF